MCIVGIDQAQWSRPDEDGSNNPSIEAWRGVETVRAVDAFSAILGTETKKKTVLRTTSRRNETKKETVLRTFSENRQGVRRRRWLSADARKWLRQSARQQLSLGCDIANFSRTKIRLNPHQSRENESRWMQCQTQASHRVLHDIVRCVNCK